MVPYEDRVSGVDLTDDELQVAQGSTITDGDGSRRATLLLEPGTEATATLPDGTAEGARRPAEHPRHRVHHRRQRPGRDAGRAAADLRLHVRGRVLGRRGQQGPGGRRPVRQADRHLRRQHRRLQGRHEGPDGLLRPREGAVDRRPRTGSSSRSSAESGGRAAVDVTGDDVADTAAVLATFGIDDDELAKLADLYNPGKSLWRAAITHFTPWDYNWPYGLPDGAGGPDQGGPDDGDPDGRRPVRRRAARSSSARTRCSASRSPIAGTPYTLVYQSDRVPGRRTGDSLEIPLTGATPPARWRASTSRSRSRAARSRSPSRARRTCARRSSSTARTPTGARPGPPEGRRHDRLRLPGGLPRAEHVRLLVRGDRRRGAVRQPHAPGDQRRPALERHGRRAERARRARSRAGASTSTTPTTRSAARSTWATAPSAARDGQNFDVISTTKTGLAAPEGMATTPDGRSARRRLLRPRRPPDRAGRGDRR